MSNSPRARRSSLADTRATNGPRSLSSTVMPSRRIAARCSPRATTATSLPARARAAARNPPIDPAPTTAIRTRIKRWRRRADLNCRMGLLQSPALPLGYVAAHTSNQYPVAVVAERVVGIEPTRQPWEGRRLPLHHTREPRQPARFVAGRRASLRSPFRLPGGQERTFTDRARISATVTNEISDSKSISIFAARVSGMVSVGLIARAFVNETYR
jgi:hypothetical protein